MIESIHPHFPSIVNDNLRPNSNPIVYVVKNYVPADVLTIINQQSATH